MSSLAAQTRSRSPASRAAPQRPTAAPAAASAPGTPRFLRGLSPAVALSGDSTRAAEHEADAFAAGGRAPQRRVEAPVRTPVHETLRRRSADAGSGITLPASLQRRYEPRLGASLRDVRLHVDGLSGRVAEAVGAEAYTLGRDIYFAPGRFRPGSTSGEHLLAHELAHVAQHGPGDRDGLHALLSPGNLQRSLPTGLGVFEIDFAQRIAPQKPGKEGHIGFDPAPSGPYSAEIGLIQSARVEANGTTSNAALGFPGGQTNDQVNTTGSQGEQAGWSVDVPYSDTNPNQGGQVSPSYPEAWGLSPGDNEHGFLRSPSDHAPARLYDYPGSSRPMMRFDFETVAHGMDNQQTYGSLHWGFEILGRTPQNEYAYAENSTSPEFDNSLDRLRAFFTHEPTVIYFDTNLDQPATGEAGKLDEAGAWLDRFPDAHVEIEGYADERGAVAMNNDLAQRRAESVAAALVKRGLDATRIDWSAGLGRTDFFAAGRQAGQLQANRRVLIRFVRNASTAPAP